VNQRCNKRVEKASRRQADADGIDDQRAVEILQDDAPAVLIRRRLVCCEICGQAGPELCCKW
jgi:hypothetical protein